MLRIEIYHRRIEDEIDPLQKYIRHTVELGYRLRSDELYYLYTLDAVHQTQFDQHRQQWIALEDKAPLLLQGDAQVIGDWKTGRADINDWMQHYAAASFKTGEQLNAPANGDIFMRGIQALDRAATRAEQVEAETRSVVRETWGAGLLAETTVGVVCLLLGLIAWRQARALQVALRDASDNADRLSLAVRETNHRVKNNLQTIGALIDMNRQEHGDAIPRRVLDEVYQQVRTVAAVHDFLSHEHRGDRVNAKLMLHRLAELAAGSGGLTTKVLAEEALLPVKEATSLALIANELVLNSGKHGAKGVDMAFCHEEEDYVLRVIDDGPGFPPDFSVAAYSNIGLNLVETLASHDLHGAAEWTNHDHTGGAVVEIRFPIPQ